MRETQCPYVSRGGLKLAAALEAFGVDAAGMACADLGCSTGGFTDCLLRHGAAKVYAIDTAYGALDWKLRNDERVVVLERTNALHAKPQAAVNLVTVDLGWTKQARAIPAALGWLHDPGWIITLIKPNYEADDPRLSDGEAEAVMKRVLDALPALGVKVVHHVESPIRGGKGVNREWLALLQPI